MLDNKPSTRSSGPRGSTLPDPYYPLIAWNSGSPPRLQVDLIHAAAGSWLECQTPRGRDRLDEVGGLVVELEVWEGSPETRWCA